MARQTEPPLTTVHQPIEQIGRRMVSLLLDSMAHPDEPPTPRLLETRLVVREKVVAADPPVSAPAGERFRPWKGPDPPGTAPGGSSHDEALCRAVTFPWW